jgi:hypothetical protein
MDIIGTDGKKLGTKPEGAPAEANAECAAPETKSFTMRSDLNTPGWMKIEINLDAISHDQQAVWKFMGFMDSHKQMGLQIVSKLAAQRAAVQAELQKQKNKGGMHKFLNGLRK